MLKSCHIIWSELTESIAEFIVRDLRLVNVIDGDGFLNLMEVAEL